MIDQLNRLLAPLKVRIANMIARSVVQIVDDSMKMQTLQLGVLEDETREGIERAQNYGFTSVPLEGAEAIVAFVGGRRDHGIAIVVDDRRYRLKSLQNGEVAMYTDEGDSIVIKRGGTVEINGSTAVKFNGGSTPVAKEGSATTGHMHTLTGTAGPYPLAGTAVTTTDTIATGAGSADIKVP